MNFSAVPCFSGVRVAQSVVFLWPVIRLCFLILFLPIVCLLFFDLRINSHSFLPYAPDKHIDLVQRRHDRSTTTN